MDYAALRSELLTDPVGMGYAPHVASGADNRLADLLNAPKAGTAFDVGILPSETVAACLVGTELQALTSAQRDTIRVYLAAGGVDVTPASAPRQYLLSLFPAGTGTRSKLAAAVTRMGSRADELGCIGVTDSDVAIALRNTV